MSISDLPSWPGFTPTPDPAPASTPTPDPADLSAQMPHLAEHLLDIASASLPEDWERAALLFAAYPTENDVDFMTLGWGANASGEARPFLLPLSLVTCVSATMKAYLAENDTVAQPDHTMRIACVRAIRDGDDAHVSLFTVGAPRGADLLDESAATAALTANVDQPDQPADQPGSES